MADKVPQFEQSAASGPEGYGERWLSANAEAEARLLSAEAVAREQRNRETDQRYILRWTVAVVTILLIFGMAALVVDNHVDLHSPPVDYFKLPTAYLVAMYVAPIVSVTVLAMALLVAAFRGYSRADEDSAAAAAAESAKEAGKRALTPDQFAPDL